MARTKKQKRGTSFVTLRTQKLSKGRESYYLDIYKDGVRRYEFLKLYLVPVVDEATRVQNQNTKQAAEAIRSAREVEIIQEKGGIKDNKQAQILLMDWLQVCKESKYTENTASNMEMVKRHISIYNKGKAVRLKDVDEAYCRGFISYLANEACGKYRGKEGKEIKGKRLCKNTASIYFTYFAGALNDAVRKGIISRNPATLLSREDKKPIKVQKSQRGYLTIDEIKAIIATDCRNKQIKQAFLFAVFCGLRISDIRGLRWEDLKKEGEQWSANILMKKTKEHLIIPLSDEAMKWLPERKWAGDNDYIFNKLPVNASSLNVSVKRMAKQAGIEKDICFHVSRHTFATTLLTLGADLYTTSKLLGHADLKTTQIYAEIVNKKKDEAVNRLSSLFND